MNSQPGLVRAKLKHVVPLVICFVLASPGTAKTQDWHHYVATRGACQKTAGPAASKDGTIGATFVQVPSCSPISVFVTSVQPGGPAAKAGIEAGDTLDRVEQQGDSIYAVPLIACELDNEIRESIGRSISLTRFPKDSSNGSPVTVQVKSRAEVYPEESVLPSSISEMVEVGMRGPAETKEAKTSEGKTITFQECPPAKTVHITILQVSERPESPVHVKIMVTNGTGALLPFNEGKVFLLDANQRQVQSVTFDERKFQDERLLYETRKQLQKIDDIIQSSAFSPPLPTPPSPPLRYSITADTDGRYTVSPAGMDAANISGSSTTTFTVKPEYDSSHSLGYLANTISYWIEMRRERKWNNQMQAQWEKVRQDAENNAQEASRLLDEWKQVGFNSARPLAPREIRSGYFLFSPSEANDISSLSLVIALTNPDTQKDQFVTFRFHR